MIRSTPAPHRAPAPPSPAWGLLLLCALACGGTIRDPTQGEISFEPNRPQLAEGGTPAPPYTGSDPLVLDAASHYITGLDFHRKVILRSCGPTNGVCHNQKEYPDMHTPAAFASTVGARCNVQPASYTTVFDRCEVAGDRFRFEDQDKEIEIGWLELIPGEYVDYGAQGKVAPEDAPGLHLHLYEPVSGTQAAIWGNGLFIRTFVDGDGNLQALPFVNLRTNWWVLGDRKHLIGDVPDYLADDAQELVASGIIQGDKNRNGIFGARTGRLVSLLNPGKPEESYLVARLRGHMQGEPIPGSRMPLANQPPSVPDMLALMCFIEKLTPGVAPNLADGINYQDCSYTADPQSLSLVGQGTTFSGKIRPMLQANCGGCHGGASPQMNLDMNATDLHTRLLQSSAEQPANKLIQPGEPQNSYLFRKVSGDGSITGQPMPLDPLGSGWRQLAPEDRTALEQWITAGALDD